MPRCFFYELRLCCVRPKKVVLARICNGLCIFFNIAFSQVSQTKLFNWKGGIQSCKPHLTWFENEVNDFYRYGPGFAGKGASPFFSLCCAIFFDFSNWFLFLLSPPYWGSSNVQENDIYSTFERTERFNNLVDGNNSEMCIGQKGVFLALVGVPRWCILTWKMMWNDLGYKQK